MVELEKDMQAARNPREHSLSTAPVTQWLCRLRTASCVRNSDALSILVSYLTSGWVESSKPGEL